ncbi:MAG TPA: hypothetical protein VMU77_07555, partial [Acidimicrobiales bacterium]|nr:hypothetical protein [Acidimicrobiales bacterium]
NSGTEQGANSGTEQGANSGTEQGANTTSSIELQGSSACNARSLELVLVAAGYLVVGLVAFWQAWSGGATHMITCGCFDQAQSAWYLAWTPFAIEHGHNPLLTTWINVPKGVNLMDNASTPLLGLVTSPITSVFGPIASWNVIALGAMSGSAFAAYLAFRKFAPWWPAAFVGGLAYGFGPYMAAQGPSHINLSIGLYPPIAMCLVYRILKCRRGNSWKWGAVLGAVSAAQLLISAEILATTIAIGGFCLVLTALLRTKQLRFWFRDAIGWVGRSILGAAAAFLAISAYPLWVAFYGPQAVTAGVAIHPEYLSANLLGFILPSGNQLFTTSATNSMVDPYFVGGFVAENATYIGLTMIAFLLVATVVYWRYLLVKVASIALVFAAFVSLGANLSIGTHRYGFPFMIYRLVRDMPLLQNALPVRFALYVDLFAGLILALSMNLLRDRLRNHSDNRINILSGTSNRGPESSSGNTRRKLMALAVPLGLALLVLLPQMPSIPFPMVDSKTPPFFTSSAVKSIPPGALVDIYPFPRDTAAEAMLWQAQSGMRFKMLGGFALVPGPDGKGQEDPKFPEVTEIWFGSAYWLAGPMPIYQSAINGIRTDLRIHHVEVVIVSKVGKDPQGARNLITASLGSPPFSKGGIWIWYDVPRLLTSSKQLKPRP